MGDEARELPTAYYNAARGEILARLQLREEVLIAGAAAFGVVGGWALNNQRGETVLFSLFPFLSFAFTLVFFRHHFLIAYLSNYINVELASPLGTEQQPGSSPSLMPLHWDIWLRRGTGRNTTAPKGKLRTILSFEMFGAWLLLWGPGMAGLISAAKQIGCSMVWIDSIVLFLALAFYLWEAFFLAFKWR